MVLKGEMDVVEVKGCKVIGPPFIGESENVSAQWERDQGGPFAWSER